MKRLRTAIASDVANVTFENDYVAGDEVCYPCLPCCLGVNFGGRRDASHYITGKSLNI